MDKVDIVDAEFVRLPGRKVVATEAVAAEVRERGIYFEPKSSSEFIKESFRRTEADLFAGVLRSTYSNHPAYREMRRRK